MEQPQPAPRVRLGSLRDLYRIVFRHLGKGAVCFAVVLGIFVGVALLMPARYESTAKLLLRFGRENVDLDLVASAGRQAGIERNVAGEIRSELAILSSEDLLRVVVTELGPDVFLAGQWRTDGVPAEDAAVRQLDTDLDVGVEPDSNIIQVTYRNPSPEQATRVVDRLIQLYLDKHIAVHRTAGAYEFLSEQSDRLETEIQGLRDQLDEVRVDSGIYAIDEQRRMLGASIATMEEEAEGLAGSIADSQAKSAALEEQLTQLEDMRVLEESTGQANPVADQMRSQLFELMLQEQELLARYSPEKREVRNVRARIAVTNELLQAEETKRTTVTRGPNEIRRQLQLSRITEEALLSGQEARFAVAQKQLHDARQRLHKLNAREGEIKELGRRIALGEANQLKYLDSLEEAYIDRILEEQKISNIRVVQAASRPTFPVGPGRIWILVAGFAVAVVASLGTMFLSEFLDESLHTPEEVEARLGLPVLASLPRSRFLRSALTRLQRRRRPWDGQLPADVARELGTMVERVHTRLDNGSGPVILGITSSSSTVGVSSIAAYLAANLARRDTEAVLLVDGNQHDSRLSEAFAVNHNGDGDAIRPTRLPGVALLGEDQSSSSDWAAVSRGFAFVIVDLPATQRSDLAVVESQRCHGILFVVDPERTRWHSAQRAIHTLGDAGARVLGVILNKRRFPIPTWLYRTL